jgi:PAS domain S-box-containing protein
VDFTECSEAIRLLGLYWLLCNQTPSRKQMSAATKFLRCLIVEDVEDDVQLLLLQLRAGGYDVTWERVDTPEAMRAALARQPWDVVLSDYRMPRFSGLSALEILRESGLDLPFIIVSGTIGEEIAVAAMKAGVDDYLIKGQLDHLMVAVERELRNAATRRERNVAEVALAETKALLQAALDHSQAGIAIADAPSGKLRYVNQVGLLIAGETEAKLVADVGINQYVASWNLLNLDGSPLATEEVPLVRAIRLGEQNTREFIIRRSEHDDRIVLANAAPVRNPAGAVTAGIVVFLDITEHKRTEAALRASEIRYRRLFEAAKDGILILDAGTGMVVDVNPFLVELLDLSREEFLGRKIWELGFFKDVVANQANFAELQQKDYIRYEDMALETRSGQRREVEFVSNVYLVNDQKVIQCNIRDISQRKREEAAFARLNACLQTKNQELERVVHVVSHDLRSPLVNIAGYGQELGGAVETLRRAIEADATTIETLKAAARPTVQAMAIDLDYIRISVAHMDTLLSGLLRLSRLGRSALAIGPLNMNELVAEVLVATTIFQVDNRGVKLQVADLPPCQGDAVQVRQVFTNLLSNALKYLDPTRPGAIQIHGEIEGNLAVYCVADNGIGIAPAHQANVFEIFHRLDPSKSEGDGLGLAIVRQAMTRLAGKVWVESKPGEGSRFYVTLPSVQAGDYINYGINGVEK